jgi:hypothetical protein
VGILPARASDVRSAAGHRVRKTSGLASAATLGTLSTLAVSAPHACTSGLKRSASLAANGRHIRIGMANKHAVG